MKLISENTQDGAFMARKTFRGEVGVCLAVKTETGKRIKNPIYWSSPDRAIEDLKAVIDYFSSKEDSA